MNKKGLKNTGFYIALCSCIAVIGAVAYVGNHTVVPKEQKASEIVEVTDSEPTITPVTPKPSNKSGVSATSAPEKSTPEPIAKQLKATKPPVKAAASQNIVEATISPTPAPTVESNFQPPLSGDIVTTFSDGALIYNKDLDDWRSHDGIDIKAEIGTDVKAVYSGVISEIINNTNGKTVKIDHKNGYVSVYSNLDENVTVKVNDSVKKGGIIGNIGRTTISEQFIEPHLHFELLENGKYVDPNKFIH